MILMIPNKTPSVILVLGILIQKGVHGGELLGLSFHRKTRMIGICCPWGCDSLERSGGMPYVRTLRVLGPSLSLPAYIFVTILLVTPFTPFTPKDEMR